MFLKSCFEKAVWCEGKGGRGGFLSSSIITLCIRSYYIPRVWSVFTPTSPNPKIPILTSTKSTRKVEKAGGLGGREGRKKQGTAVVSHFEFYTVYDSYIDG